MINYSLEATFPVILSQMQPEDVLNLQKQAIEASINGIVIADMRLPDCPLIYVNSAFERMSGYKTEEIIGRNCRFLQGVHHDSESNLAPRQQMRVALAEGVSCNVVLENFRKDGTPFWNELFMAPIFDDEGVLTHYVGIQNEVTGRVKAEQALQEAHDEMEQRAFHDTLTSLPNRALLLNRLQQALARAARTGDSIGLLFMDLDNFKTINDTLGHEAGDILLQTIAERLRRCTRPGDTVARWGGDEFVILLEGLSGISEAEVVAERATEAIHLPLHLGEHDVIPGASIGLTITVFGDVRSVSELLRDADTAMYQSKLQGKGRYSLFPLGTNTHAVTSQRPDTGHLIDTKEEL